MKKSSKKLDVRLTLGDLLGSGTRALTRYTGTLLAVFVVQSIVAIAVMLACAVVLSQVFAHAPMWDEAVDGDLVSLVTALRFAKANILACAGIGFSALLLWELATWFLAGGIYGVFAQRPEGRAETARTFGASGTATYLSYARLALCQIPGLLVSLFVFALCTNAMSTRLEHALSVADLVVPTLVMIGPPLLILHVLWTVGDYSRVELTLRHDSHDPGVVITYLRSLGFVIKRPLALLHASLGWLGWIAITVGYMWLASGHPMFGTEGAVTLFVIRSGVSLARMALRFAVLAGQVDLGGSRALPPRRVEIKAEPKPQ
ncbi:MAG TPA: hypothetical protein VGC41_26940 [Kofleriaceae bacterium]